MSGDDGLFFSEFPLVLTPSRLPQPQNEAAAAVTVIDRETIRATGYRDIPRLLRLVPGMQVGQERGSSHWVTYHGMGNDFPSWMQVLIDGRSVYSPSSFSGVDWTGLPITVDEIERIEVVRGTHAAAYGSNAFLGVINIITRDAADHPGQQLSLQGGNAGIAGMAVEHSAASGGGGLRVNFQHRQDQGFADLHDSQALQVLSLRGDKSLDGHNDLMFRFAAADGWRELGYPDSIYDNNGERQADSRNLALHVQWRHAPRADEEWLLHFYRNQDRMQEAWVATGPPPGNARVPLDRNRQSVRNAVELQHRRPLAEGLRTVWGMELRHDAVESPFLYYGQARQQERLARLFGQLEWRFQPDWTLNASGLVEQFDGDAPYYSPRLFANWAVSPEDTLRLGYARAWRHPPLFERYGDVRALYQGRLLVHPFLPNPDLRAPRMDSIELGYLGQRPAAQLRWDLRLFVERIRDYVIRVSHPEDTDPLLAGTLPSARYENLDHPVTLSGLEYQLESRPFAGTRFLFSHALIRRISDHEDVTRYTAPYSASLSWFQDWGQGWSSALSMFRMGPLAGGSGFVPTAPYASPSYTTFDLRVARSLRLGTTPAEVALVATNLGGRHQEIADRAEQALHGDTPANRTSPAIWLTLSLNPK